MGKQNWLQKRVGGPFSGQSSRLIAAGKKALVALEPKVRRALDEHQARLETLVLADRLDTIALYALAHDVRGLAGTFGYSSLGLIADATARYILACEEHGQIPHDAALRVLVQAMDQAFVKDEEGGDTLTDLTAGALALVRAKMPAEAA